MITKVTKDNKALYDALFQKASVRLNERAEQGADEISISSLDEYFCYLTDLFYKDDDEESLDYSFVILPVDEPLFEIDANTRVINVPSEFKKNGISVQGDHLAEILYFSIDRYYDTVDLADNDIKIFIQCEVPGGDTPYLCSALHKDITTLKNQGKMIFGWSINEVLTKKSGVLKFSVRFIRADNDPQTGKKKVNFSLSTLTTSATINQGLDFAFVDGESSVPIIDDLTTLKNRVKDSIPYNTDVEAPIPEFIINIPASSFDEITEDEITYLLTDLQQNGIKLIVQAVSDEGIVSYEWHKADLASGTNGDVINGSDEYVLSTDTEWSTQYLYYTKSVVDNRDVYEVFNITGLEPDDENLPDLYIKCNSITAGSTGNYWVVAKNRKGIALASAYSNYVRIPGPGELSVAVDDFELGDDDIYQVILNEDGEFELVATGSTSRLGNDAGVGDKITYTWTEDGERDDPLIANAINDVENNGVESSFAGEVEVEDRALFNHTIKLDVVASRNGDTTVEPITKKFRITDAAHAPTVERTVNRNIDIAEGTLAHLEVEAHVQGIVSDELTYQWYKYTSNPNDDDELLVGKTDYELNIGINGTYYCKVTNHVNGTTAVGVPDSDNYITVQVS